MGSGWYAELIGGSEGHLMCLSSISTIPGIKYLQRARSQLNDQQEACHLTDIICPSLDVS